MRLSRGIGVLIAALVTPAGLVVAKQDTTAAKPVMAKGVYTDSQATRGGVAFQELCSACHLPKDHNNDDFKTAWNGRTIRALYDYIRSTMPDDDPGTLSEQQYLDVTAYILKLNGMPTGDIELTSDTTRLNAATLTLRAALLPASLLRR